MPWSLFLLSVITSESFEHPHLHRDGGHVVFAAHDVYDSARNLRSAREELAEHHVPLMSEADTRHVGAFFRVQPIAPVGDFLKMTCRGGQAEQFDRVEKQQDIARGRKRCGTDRELTLPSLRLLVR